MHVQTHILSGWCVGNLVPRLGARERLSCMIAASAADVDGLGIVAGQEAYQTYHHVLGHNLLFAALIGGLLAAMSARGRRAIGLVAYLSLAHLHLLMDYYGSGPGWPICYWWPFARDPHDCWMNSHAWEFYSWQNLSAAFGLLAVTVVIAAVCRRTPLELLMPSLDRRLVGRATS